MPLLPFACRDVLRDGRGAGLRQPAENVGRRHGALGRSFRLRKRWTLLHDGYDRLGRGIGVRLLCIVRSGCMGVRRSPVPQVPGPFRRRSFLGSGGRALRGPLLYDIQLSGPRARRAAFVSGCQRPAGGTVRGALHALVRSGFFGDRLRHFRRRRSAAYALPLFQQERKPRRVRFRRELGRKAEGRPLRIRRGASPRFAGLSAVGAREPGAELLFSSAPEFTI